MGLLINYHEVYLNLLSVRNNIMLTNHNDSNNSQITTRVPVDEIVEQTNPGEYPDRRVVSLPARPLQMLASSRTQL